jgi:hypothetical protein
MSEEIPAEEYLDRNTSISRRQYESESEFNPSEYSTDSYGTRLTLISQAIENPRNSTAPPLPSDRAPISERKTQPLPISSTSQVSHGGSGNGNHLLRVLTGGSNHETQEIGSHSPLHLTSSSQATQLVRPLIGVTERFLEEGGGRGEEDNTTEEIMIPVNFDTSHV